MTTTLERYANECSACGEEIREHRVLTDGSEIWTDTHCLSVDGCCADELADLLAWEAQQEADGLAALACQAGF